MNRSNLSKIAGAGILSLSLTFLPSTLPASAQATTAVDSTPARGYTINSSAANWLGVIGIVCLALLTREYAKQR